MTNKFTTAFDHFADTLDAIRTRGTSAITPEHIADWRLKQVSDGTMIGTVPYSDGTVFHLSVGPFQIGTSYPTKYGAHVTDPHGIKLVWFDWNSTSDEKHGWPHVQFSDNPKKRYRISDERDWGTICMKIDQLKMRY